MESVTNNKEFQKTANRIMRNNGLKVVYLAADGQWFSKKENAEKHSGEIKPQEFKLKK